jgi:hypothetical protein
MGDRAGSSPASDTNNALFSRTEGILPRSFFALVRVRLTRTTCTVPGKKALHIRIGGIGLVRRRTPLLRFLFPLRQDRQQCLVHPPGRNPER